MCSLHSGVERDGPPRVWPDFSTGGGRMETSSFSSASTYSSGQSLQSLGGAGNPPNDTAGTICVDTGQLCKIANADKIFCGKNLRRSVMPIVSS